MQRYEEPEQWLLYGLAETSEPCMATILKPILCFSMFLHSMAHIYGSAHFNVPSQISEERSMGPWHRAPQLNVRCIMLLADMGSMLHAITRELKNSP